MPRVHGHDERDTWYSRTWYTRTSSTQIPPPPQHDCLDFPTVSMIHIYVVSTSLYIVLRYPPRPKQIASIFGFLDKYEHFPLRV